MFDLSPCAPGPRIRVISDNDYAGDPDGLVQLAHLALSPSVELCGVVASHLRDGDPFDPSGRSAANGAAAARTVLELAGRSRVQVVAGRETALHLSDRPDSSAGAELIVREALRTDSDLPLYVTLGGGLTELAAAYRLEPRIADRLTAVWIGGPEHPGLGGSPPPGAAAVEYNLAIDLPAAQVVFSSAIPLWQVPRNSYRQVLVSAAELAARVRPAGELGAHLYRSIADVGRIASGAGLRLGETYVLGDNPLVLLTALMSSFEMDPSSSASQVIPRPSIGNDGCYIENRSGAPIRVFSRLDVRLLLEDLYAKLGHSAGWTS